MYPMEQNPICEQMKHLPITGNLIPKQWYHTIVKPDRKRPTPHRLAIDILGEVVFRYRPVLSGDGLEWEKSFREDLLQMSYGDLAALFNTSAESAKDAVCFLEQLGVLRRVFRTVRRAGRSLPNVLYLELNVPRLGELTGTPGDAVPPSGENSPHPGGETPHTNTKNTITKPEDHLYTTQSQPENLPGARVVNGCLFPPDPGEPVTDLVFSNKEELLSLLRRAVNYKLYMSTGYLVNGTVEEKDRWRQVFRITVDQMAELCTFSGTRRFSFGTRTAADVLAAFRRLIPYEDGGGLSALAEVVTQTYLAEAESRSVRNGPAYLAAMLVAFAEFPEAHGIER